MIPLKDSLPTKTFPLVTLGLILANVVVYVLAIRHGGSLISGPDTQEVVRYGSIPYALTHGLGGHCGLIEAGRVLACGKQAPPGTLPAWQTAFTAMFMHASIVHIAGNMIFLWIFGNNVEDALGHVKYLAFYLVGGLVALGLQVGVSPNSVAPTLGASGAIAAVLGAYIVLYPRARVLTLVIIIFFVTLIELPALLLLGLWFVEQAVFGATGLITPTGSSGGVAYFAHIGGFAFGLLSIKALTVRRRPPPVPVVE